MSSFLTTAQTHAIEATERACSALSMAASLLVVGTYLGSGRFQTPINRLIFYATWGNILTNIGTFVGRDGIAKGEGSSLCTFQAFFIQWFMAADPLWSFCMALNVYLTLFRRFRTSDLKRLEWMYFLLAYGLPFPPAVVLSLVHNDHRGRVYGPAVLWCWISPSWNFLRIAVFYGPIWVVLLITFSIYLYAGKEIAASRRKLSRIEHGDTPISNGGRNADEEHNWITQPSRVNPGLSQTRPGPTPDIPYVTVDGTRESTEEYAMELQRSSPSASARLVKDRPANRNEQKGEDNGNRDRTNARVDAKLSSNSSPSVASPQSVTSQEPSRLIESEGGLNTPVSAQPETHKTGMGDARYPMNAEGNGRIPPDVETAPIAAQPSNSESASLSRAGLQRSAEKHSSAYRYAKRAILFFIALLTTWIPASINRIYLLSHPEEPNFALAYIAALFLPLQGFWNAVVYVTTSYDVVKELCITVNQSLWLRHSRPSPTKMAAGRNRELGVS